ncbi:MAG: hypothetical protein ACRDY2_13815 [Acidimicrobiales bacterium]
MAVGSGSTNGALAKLTSWTEVSALMQSIGYEHGITQVPSALTGAPWKPVWAVLIGGNKLVVLDATTAQVEATIPAGNQPSWFAALTNRDPAQAGCPGGSTSRVPFGVLTRNEESYMLRNAAPGAPKGAITSMTLKLTTVPVLNRADPGLYGGCVQQSCTLDELVWVPVTVVQAQPGKTLACLPASVSYPAGYRPKQVSEYTTLSVPGNAQISCGPPPPWVSRLADLAPPSPGHGG